MKKIPKLPNDKPRCACGIFGIFNHPEASILTYYGLYSLQHRGQEASGIVTSIKNNNKTSFNFHKGIGLVTDVFKDSSVLEKHLLGNSAIGHNRYSTTGSANNKLNIQPFTVLYKNGNLAVAHNGNLTNFKEHRKKLENSGTIFQTTSDSELFLHLIARSKSKDQKKQIVDSLSKIEGAFSVLILTDNGLIAARDTHAFRPLAIGEKDGAIVVASETCAFDIIGAKYIRDVLPGEIIFIEKNAKGEVVQESIFLKSKNKETHHCIFEYIYFSRPDSKIFGGTVVDKIRRKLGKSLAQESPFLEKNDKAVIISVPDSSNTASLGYYSESEKMHLNVKLDIGLIRNHYVGRTFIQPNQKDRELKVRTKFNTVKDVLRNKKIIVIDDSIVRGTTSKKLVKLLREANPKEIHLKITSPPIVNPCYYGMDFPSREELIAVECNADVETIRKEIGVDSLHYLSHKKLLESVPKLKNTSYCSACFGGKYPTKVKIKNEKNALDN